MAKKLTDKQKAFCDEYLVDLNATQAARSKLERISPIHHTRGGDRRCWLPAQSGPDFRPRTAILPVHPEVSAVWQVDRPYFNLPGYYYLHRTIHYTLL